MIIDWLDLPKLTTLTGNSINDCDTFRNPHHITLESDSPPTLIIIRHAPSHNCHFDKRTSVLLQEWRHHPRKHTLHLSLTNRHRRSSTLLQLITETCMIYSSFCSLHNTLVHQKIAETHEIVSDSNERRVLYALPFPSELIIGLETIHVFNTPFDRVERTESASEKVTKRPISPFYYGLRLYTNRSIEGYSIIDLVNSSAIS